MSTRRGKRDPRWKVMNTFAAYAMPGPSHIELVDRNAVNIRTDERTGCFYGELQHELGSNSAGLQLRREGLRFAPYASVGEPNAEVRNALRNLLIRSKQRGEPAFLYVTNRLEGFAPGTIRRYRPGIWATDTPEKLKPESRAL